MRTTVLLAAALAALAGAAPASAGQIVYNTEPADGDAQIRVMNDDGTNDRLLVHEDDIPGAESVYKPYVSPDGATIVFQARTPSPGGYGVFCGFRCSGIYAYSAGKVTRISQAPTDCPPGDLCLGLDVDPRITGDGSHLFYEMIYGEPGGSYGTPQTISSYYYRSMAPDGGEVELPQTSCGKGGQATPNPAVDGQFATSAYCLNGNYALKVMDMGGAEETLVSDDADFSGLAFRGDGQALVGAEGGGDPGLWVYPRDGSDARRIAAITWDYDHSAYESSPTFVGGDKVAFIHGDSIRTVSAACGSCALDATSELATRKEMDSIAWTAQSIPSPAVDTPQGDKPSVTPTPPVQGGDQGQPGGPGGGPPAQPLVLKVPATAKLATALRGGVKVPFLANGPGALELRATVAPALAKKLRLVRRAKKPVVVARGATTVARAGEATLTLKLTAAAKKRLKRAKSVPLTLTGTFAGTAISGQLKLAR